MSGTPTGGFRSSFPGTGDAEGRPNNGLKLTSAACLTKRRSQLISVLALIGRALMAGGE